MGNSPRVPKYSLHKCTGPAVVRIKGRFIYLGQHGSPKSHAAYAQVISDFLASREIRCPRTTATAEPEPRPPLTLGQLITRYGRATKASVLGSRDKPPLNIETSYKCNCNDPANWHTFSEALASQQAGHFDGIGFVCGKGEADWHILQNTIQGDTML